jgi:hypothetical protein
MPWEIDYALLSFSQFKKSKYYLPSDINVEIETVLNLSSYIIDWEESKLPKDFFIEKYNQISNLLVDYKHNKNTYDGKELYGHLDFQRESISQHVDFYIHVCPDMYFSEHLISLLIQSSQHIDNKYFVVTPEISKLWDFTWDEITNEKYQSIPYDQWNEVDVFSIRNDLKLNSTEISLAPTSRHKWAGWFDLYNKQMWEELCPVQEDWKGYGPHDWYSLILTEHLKSKGIDFQQYVLRGQTIFEYSVGPLKNGGFSNYYKDLLHLNEIPNQRQQFESKMNEYLQKGIQQLQSKNII